MINNYISMCKSITALRMRSWQKKVAMLLVFVFFSVMGVNAQVATNSGSGLASTYPTLAGAITALNAATITSPVVITLTGNETSPAGGYNITATGTSTNTITIQGSSSTITAPTNHTAGSLVDALFKITGGDWITIKNFTMLENASNTVTTAASNTMTEFGVALFYATTTNGAQNCTIQNNTITLNRTYQNTFGIYSNSTHSATVPLTTGTGLVGGGNSGLKIYGNTISNVNMGIIVIGPLAAANHNTGIDIGGTASGTGNTITNFGTTGTLSSYFSVSATLNGIVVRNSTGFNVSYNSITSSNGGITTSATLRGIFIPSFNNAPTGTFTNTINNNTIALTHGFTSGTIQGITVESTTGNATSTQNINNNNFTALGSTVATSGTITAISNVMPNLANNFNGNTFTNISTNTTGSFTFFGHSYTMPSGGSQTFNGNSIVTAFSKTGAGGSVIITSTNGTSPVGTAATYTNNNFSNITVTGATTLTGFNNTDGGVGSVKTITGNTFNSWTGGTSALNPMNFSYFNGTSTLSSNTVTNITGQSSVTGININASASGTLLTVASNIINNLTSTGTGGAVIGLSCTNASTTININGNAINTLSSTGSASVVALSIGGGATTNVFQNKIYNISGSNAGSTVNGILISAGLNINTYNNIIGDLTATAASGTDVIRGINITSATGLSTQKVYGNTIYLNAASSGANFGSTGLFHTRSATATTAVLDMRNNIIVNASSAAGTGLAVAFRRSASTDLVNYATSSNNNMFFGTSGVYTDGAATYAFGPFQTLVSTRETASRNQNPSFASTTGANATFLHFVADAVNLAGANAQVIAGYTTDFDGDTRDASTPDIGADEWVNGVIALPTVASFTPATLCLAGGQTVTITGANLSTVTSVLFNSASGVDLPGVITGATDTTLTVTTPANAVDGIIRVVNPAGSADSAATFATAAAPTIGVSAAVTICSGSGTSLTATGGATYSWSPATGLSATTGDTVTASPTTTTTYTVTGTSAVGCTATNTVTVTVSPTPTAITLAKVPTIACLGGTTTLTAAGGLAQTAYSTVIGTGTSTTSSSGSYAAFNGYRPSAWIQTIYTAAELTAAGIAAGTINSIAYNKGTQGSSTANTITIKIGTTANSAFANTTLYSTTGYTTVYGPTSYTHTSSGWQTINFSTPYTWDGVSNIVVDVWQNGPDSSADPLTYYTTTPDNKVNYIWSIAAGTANAVGNLTTSRFNVTFTGVNSIPTVLAWSPTTDLFSDAAATTAYAGENVRTVYSKSTTAQTYTASATLGSCSATSAGITVTPNPLPTISVANASICNGGSTPLTASGAATYAWSPATGLSATTGTEVTANPTVTTIYTITGTDSNGCINTTTATVTVNEPVVITTPPSNQITLENGAATFGVTASGTGLSYQWQTYNTTTLVWDNLLGETAATYTIASAPVSLNTSQYRVIVSGTAPCAPVTSSSATLTVSDVAISAQPMAQTICSNGIATFSITATGAVTSYQWQYTNDGIAWFDVDGEITNEYVLSGLTAANSGIKFRCSLNGGAVYSNDALLTVYNAVAIGTQPTNQTVCSNAASVTFTSLATASNLTYQWQVSTSAVPAWTNIVNATAADYTINTPGVGLNTNQYRVIASGSAPCSAVTSDVATLTVNQVVAITTQPTSVTQCSLLPTATFSVVATGTGVGYQWQFSTDATNYTDLVGETAASLVLSTPATYNGNSFRCLVNGASPCATVTSSVVTLNLSQALGGTYTVGTGGNYATLTAAVAAYNAAICFSGPVVFNLTDATYSTGETFPVVINANANVGTTTLTIKPNTTTTITGSSTNSILRLNGADYVIIDGSNNGSSTRDLSVINTSTSGSSVIRVASTGGATSGATNNVIKNTIVTGGSGTVSGIYGIVSSASTGFTTGAENNDNLLIDNNLVTNVYNGITAFGNATSTQDGLVISRNKIGSTVNAARVINRGIQVSYTNNPSITRNEIIEMITNTSISIAAIDLGSGVINGSVDSNRINNLKSTSTGGYGAYGINFSSATLTSGTLVANNMISNIETANYSATSSQYNGFGIRIAANVPNLKIYNNTVHLFGAVGAGTSAGMSAAFCTGVAVTGLDVRNNIFSNVQTFGTTGSFAYAAYLTSGTTFTNSNYNDYSGTSGTNTTFQVGGVYSTTAFSTTGYADLAAWKVLTTQDAQSISVAPVFTSNTDLHLNVSNNIPLDNFGTPLAAVTTDYDGNARSATPDMGADEFSTLYCTGTTPGTITSNPASICTSGTANVRSTGYAIGLGTTYEWEKATDLAFTAPVSMGAASSVYANVSTGTITATTYYRLKVVCNAGTPEYSTPYAVVVNIAAITTVSPAVAICSGSSTTLTAAGSSAYAWSPATGLSAATGDTVTANPTATTTYTVTGTDANGCSTTATVVVTVNAPLPSITAAVVNPAVCVGGKVNLTSTSAGSSLNYTEGFETFPTPPTAWTFINAGSGNAWGYSTTSNSGVNALTYGYNSSFAANAWAISPGQTMTAGVTYTISYYYRASGFAENLKLTVGTANTVAAQTTTLMSQVGVTTDTYTLATITYSPSTSGVYYFGLNCYSTADQFNLYVDDFAISGGVTPTYAWTSSPAGFTSSVQNPTDVTVSEPTTYTVTAVNGACSTTSSITVTPNPLPNFALTSDVTICKGLSTTLSAVGTGYTYVWSPATGLDGTTSASVSANPMVTTTYTVEATETATGCKATKLVTVTVSEPGAILALGTTTSQIAIIDGSTTFTVATAPGVTYTYQWQLNDGTGFVDLSNDSSYSGVTSATLTVNGIQESWDTYQYQCLVTGTSPCAVLTPIVATLTVSTTGIAQQPQNVTLCEGTTSSSFTIVTSGDEPYGITWQMSTDNGATYADLIDGPDATTGLDFLGVDQATLNVSGITLANSGVKFLCVLNFYLPSSPATLTVKAAIAIATQPVNQSICAGGTATFTAAATGDDKTYQWQVNSGSGWANYVGADATTASITLVNPALSADGSQYRVVVSGYATCAPVTSEAASLTIINPTVSANPAAASVVNGNAATFSVTALQATSYQWQYSTTLNGVYANVIADSPTGISYSGATSATLTATTTLGATVTGAAGYYRCIASNGSCSATSIGALLTVVYYCTPAPSSVDGTGITNVTLGSIANPTAAESGNFGDYTALSTSVAQLASVNFGITYATGFTYGTRIWIDFNDDADFTDAGELVYSGVSASTNPTTLSGTIAIPLTAPVGVHRLRIGGTDDDTVNNPCYTGSYGTYEDYTIEITAAPVCSGTPVAGTASAVSTALCSGNSASLTLSGTTASLGISQQWYSSTNNVDFTPIVGETAATLATGALSANAYYYCAVTCANSAETVNSNTVTITVSNPLMTGATPAGRCGTGTVTLAATASEGDVVNWYAAATGGAPLATGTSFTTPSISANTTYYAEATTTPITASGLGNTSIPTSGFNSSERGIVFTANNNGTIVSAQYYSETLNVTNTVTVRLVNNTTGVQVGSSLTLSIVQGATAGFYTMNLNLPVQAGTSYRLLAGFSSSVSRISSGVSYSSAAFNNLAPLGVITSGWDFGLSTTTYNFFHNIEVISSRCPSARTAVLATVDALPTATISYTGSPFCSTATPGAVTRVGTTGGIYSSTVGLTIDGATGAIDVAASTPGSYLVTYAMAATTYCAAQTATTTVVINQALTSGFAYDTTAYCSNQGVTTPTVTGTAGVFTASPAGLSINATTGAITLATSTAGTYTVSNTVSVAGCANSVSTASVTVNTAVAITSQPAGVSKLPAENTSFAVTASGTGVTYQWQVNSGSGWGNLSDDSTYAGTTTATLSLTAVTMGMDQYQYQVIVSGATACLPVTSSAATLTVNDAAISGQPANYSACNEGATSATFAVITTGSVTTYQWQVNTGSGFVSLSNAGVYSGADTATLSLTGLDLSYNNYTYRCVVNGAVFSNAGTLTVNTAVAITTQPIAVTACTTSTTGFTVAATGSGLTYQWQVNSGSGWSNLANDSVYSGVTSASLGVASPTASMNGYQYQAVVSGASPCAAVTSSAATLTVNAAIAVTTQPVATSVCLNGNGAFTVAASGTAPTYAWEVNTGSAWEAVVDGGVYSNATTATLAITGATLTMEGYQYRVVVSGASPCGSVTSSAVALTISQPAAPIMAASSVAACAGVPQLLSVTNPTLGTSSTIITSGTGTSSTNGSATGAALSPNPMQSYYGGTRQQSLYTAAELTALGIANGAVLSSVAINLSAVETRVLQNYTVKMKNTTTTTFATSTFETGATTVRNAAGYQPVVGWNTLALDSNFTYTGGSLLVEFTFSNADGGGSGTNVATYNTTTNTATLYYRGDSASAATVAAATTATYSQTRRNNMQFGVLSASTTWSPTTGLFTDAAGTIPYTGSGAANVYAKVSTSAVYTATNVNGLGCTNTSTVSVNVATPSTVSSITQPLITCSGAQTTFNLTGLLPNSTSTISYTVNAGATQTVAAVVADASGNATFTRAFSAINNGQTFAITAIQRTDVTPSCTTAIAANNTVVIAVQPTVTYFADADGDTYGNNAVSIVTCQGQPAGYVTNNTDCNDSDITKNATFPFYADNDGDGFGAGTAVSLCAVNATTPPTAGYVTNNTDCNDSDITKNATFPFYADNDADGYGAGIAVAVCAVNATTPPAGYSVNNTDCDDADPKEKPGQVWYTDTDNDNYPSDAATVTQCLRPVKGKLLSELAATTLDCEDNDATINPGAVDVCYDGIDNDCNGIIDNGCVPLVSTVQTSQCGQTLAKIDDYVYANLVSGAQGYRFKVTNMVTNQVQTIDRFLRVFRITQLPNYAFNTEYQVEVTVRKNNVWQPFYGAPCMVKTPATTSQLVNCGASLTAMTDVIYANLVPFATGYRFRVTNILNPLDTQVINRSLREFRMSLLTDMQYSTTYNVEVAVRDTDGVTYLPYGPICEVTTPIFPASYLQDSQCDDYEVPSTNTILYAQSFTGAEGYRFRLQNLGEGYTQEVDRNLRTVRLSDFTGLAPGATYTVKVALKINGVWGSFTGKSCSIITPGGARAIETEAIVVKGNFAAVAYPNPFASTFAIKVQTSSQDVVQLKVYDMIGRLVEQRESKADSMDTVQLGDRYPSGVYNVVVTQGSVTETLRVVKR